MKNALKKRARLAPGRFAYCCAALAKPSRRFLSESDYLLLSECDGPQSFEQTLCSLYEDYSGERDFCSVLEHIEKEHFRAFENAVEGTELELALSLREQYQKAKKQLTQNSGGSLQHALASADLHFLSQIYNLLSPASRHMREFCRRLCTLYVIFSSEGAPESALKQAASELPRGIIDADAALNNSLFALLLKSAGDEERYAGACEFLLQPLYACGSFGCEQACLFALRSVIERRNLKILYAGKCVGKSGLRLMREIYVRRDAAKNNHTRKDDEK